MKASIVLPALFLVLISVLRYAHSYQECTCFTDCKDLTTIQKRLFQRLVIPKKAIAYVSNTRHKECKLGTKCCVEDLSSRGWTWYNNRWNKIFPYSGTPLNAARFCKKHGARLVRVTSASHQSFLKQFARGKYYSFIIDAKEYEHFDGTPLKWRPSFYRPSPAIACVRLIVKWRNWFKMYCHRNYTSQAAACEILS